MADKRLEGSPSKIIGKAVWVAVGGSFACQVLLIVLLFLRPDLPPAWHSISEWAIGPHGLVMSASFFVYAISYLFLFIVARTQTSSPTGRIGLVILLLCAVGVAGAGLFTTDPMPLRPPLSLRGILHVICGMTQLVLFPLAALLVSMDMARTIRAGRSKRFILLFGGLPLFGFLGFAAYTFIYVMPLGSQAYGQEPISAGLRE